LHTVNRFPLDLMERPARLPLHHANPILAHDHLRGDRVEAVQGVGGDRRVHEDKFTRA
jgi:hypothetical protein